MSRDSLPLPPAPREPLGREDVTVLVPGSAGAFPAKAVLTEATRGRLEMHLLTAESSCWLEWNTARGAPSQAQPAHTRLVLGVWRAPSPAHSPVLRPGAIPPSSPKAGAILWPRVSGLWLASLVAVDGLHWRTSQSS